MLGTHTQRMPERTSCISRAYPGPLSWIEFRKSRDARTKAEEVSHRPISHCRTEGSGPSVVRTDLHLASQPRLETAVCSPNRSERRRSHGPLHSEVPRPSGRIGQVARIDKGSPHRPITWQAAARKIRPRNMIRYGLRHSQSAADHGRHAQIRRKVFSRVSGFVSDGVHKSRPVCISSYGSYKYAVSASAVRRNIAASSDYCQAGR